MYQGIFFYDSLILGILAGYILDNNIKKSQLTSNTTLSMTIIIYIIYLIFSITADLNIKYIIKDLRPLILLIECHIIYELVIKRINIKNGKMIDYIVIFSGAMSIIKLVYFQYNLSIIDDVFYNENSHRYLDASTYICAVYLIMKFSKSSRILDYNTIGLLSTLMAVSSLMIANSRFILIGTILAILFSNIKNIFTFMKKTLITSVFAVVFIGYSVISGSKRVIESFNLNQLIYQINSRYQPAIEVINEFTLSNYIFGKGIGTSFFIPWFTHRDLDPYNINIDSGYLTFYAKFGLISIFLTFVYIKFIITSTNFKDENKVSLFVGIIFIVSATPYQIYAIGIFLAFAYIKQNEKYNVSNK
jgi:serine/threonine protein kinase